MIIAAAQREMLLGPDDLSAQLKPAGAKIGGDNIAAQGAEPHIGNISGEQRISLAPVGAIVVEYLALRQIARTLLPARSPGRVVANLVRRIGDHQVRPRSRQHGCDIHRAGAVAAADPVVAQQPHITQLTYRLFQQFRNAVGIAPTIRSQVAQVFVQLIRLEADQIEVKFVDF